MENKIPVEEQYERLRRALKNIGRMQLTITIIDILVFIYNIFTKNYYMVLFVLIHMTWVLITLKRSERLLKVYKQRGAYAKFNLQTVDEYFIEQKINRYEKVVSSEDVGSKESDGRGCK